MVVTEAFDTPDRGGHFQRSREGAHWAPIECALLRVHAINALMEASNIGAFPPKPSSRLLPVWARSSRLCQMRTMETIYPQWGCSLVRLLGQKTIRSNFALDLVRFDFIATAHLYFEVGPDWA